MLLVLGALNIVENYPHLGREAIVNVRLWGVQVAASEGRTCGCGLVFEW